MCVVPLAIMTGERREAEVLLVQATTIGMQQVKRITNLKPVSRLEPVSLSCKLVYSFSACRRLARNLGVLFGARWHTLDQTLRKHSKTSKLRI